MEYSPDIQSLIYVGGEVTSLSVTYGLFSTYFIRETELL